MSFFKNLIRKVVGASDGEIKDPNGMYFYIQCAKCGAPVRVRADKAHDFELDYDTGERVLRKEVMDGGCFSLMYATVRVNAAYQVIEQSVEGGRFISWEEYNRLAHPTKATTPEDEDAG